MAKKNKQQEIFQNMLRYLSALNLKESTKKAVLNYFYFALTYPKKIDDQVWFWSKEWQAGEHKAELDIRKKRISKKFKDVQSAIDYLNQ